MKKNLLLVSLAASLIATGLSSCGTSTNDPTIIWDENKTYNVGICQLVTHDALDAATQGFKDALIEGLGDHVKFDEQNAAGDSGTCTTIANSFVSKNVDLIMANATPALQAAANSTLSIPILGTSITEYGVALNIDNFDGVVGGNISGTSDLAPLDEQAKMILDLFPDASKVGVLYCAAESNSKYQSDVVVSELKKQKSGIETKVYTFSDSNDIKSTLDKAVADGLDVLYIPTDNTCASNGEIIKTTCLNAKLPVFAGEEGICKACGTFTLSISYYNIGKVTGEMALQIIKEGAHISKMPIKYDDQPVKKYNKQICDELGLNVPEGYSEIQ